MVLAVIDVSDDGDVAYVGARGWHCCWYAEGGQDGGTVVYQLLDGTDCAGRGTGRRPGQQNLPQMVKIVYAPTATVSIDADYLADRAGC